MRSLYSGVAGLKTHQTKMDVIGNNIANTNTAGFKSSSVNFSDTFYQTISGASGANAATRTAGTNAKQIGLGSMVAAIQTNITDQGGPSTTNRALDVAINGESFLIVRSGNDTCFTKSGALNVDNDGNLYCTTNGATVQGWLTDKDGNVIKDMVKDLKVMSDDNQYYPPEASGSVSVSGNIDPNDPDVDVDTGKGEIVTASFFDKIGDSYTIKFSIKKAGAGKENAGKYTVSVVDVLNSKSESIFVKKSVDEKGIVSYAASGAQFTFGDKKTLAPKVDKNTGELNWDGVDASQTLVFGTSSGDFVSLTPKRKRPGYEGAINFSITKDANELEGEATTFPQYTEDGETGGLNIFFDSLTQYSQGGTSKLSSAKGDKDGLNAGYRAGKMKGISVDQEGKVWGNYDNGLKKCLAQMAVATFANPSGLESVGTSLFAATLNSGDFDGVGQEISLDGGSFTVGALEMSNVDLANEFTQMITTQRGFQANSRIITTSDSMLEELVNLKR